MSNPNKPPVPSPARIDPSGNPYVDTHCRTCRYSHYPTDPHRGLPPGTRYDPIIRYREADDPKPAIGRWFTVETARLVDPDGCYWVSIRELEVLAWMCREAVKKQFEAPYRTPTIFNLLQGQPSCTGSHGPLKIFGPKWGESVRKSLAYAILCRTSNKTVAAWREALGISYGATLRIPGPTIRPWTLDDRRKTQPGLGSLTGRVNAVLSVKGSLAWQLNTCWADAVLIQNVSVSLGEHVYIDVHYGLDDAPCASSWSRRLAVQKPGEPLAYTFDRAGAELGRLLDPLVEPPVIEKYKLDGGVAAKPAPWVEQGNEQAEEPAMAGVGGGS